jgi:SAM-dependent methyltransferase
MEARRYAWVVETRMEREAVRAVLDRFRPFRIEVNFSNGFSTAEYGDQVAYANREPLEKAHYFEGELPLDRAPAILDVGCHLGYYGHYLLHRGARSYTGVELDERLFDSATLLRALSQQDLTRLRLIHGDFGWSATRQLAAAYGPYDIILSLASVNNIPALTSALLPLPELMAATGLLVIEYLAIETDEPVCRFHADGFAGDSTFRWSFSETFLDQVLGSVAIVRTQRLLEWKNDAVLGRGHKKIMAVYRRTPEQQNTDA